MKKLFLFQMIYYLLLNLIGPMLYYMIRGEVVFIYGESFPMEYIWKAIGIISIPIIIAIIIVCILPIGKEKIKKDLKRNMEWYFIAACIFTFIKARIVGNFASAMAGNINGTAWGYVGIFFDLGVLLIAILVASEGRAHIVLLGTLYLLTTLACFSRQGALILVMAILLALLLNDNYKKIRKRIALIVLCICLIAPILFVISSENRGGEFDSLNDLTDLIVGRCSQFELLGKALYQSDNGLWEEEIFREKYSIENQAKLFVNSVVPGDVFEDDILPNQYYRMIFMGYSEETVKQAYASFNLTLPGYLVLKYPLIVSIIGTTLAIMIIYIVACYAKWPSYFSVILLVLGINSVMGFFDWVTVFMDMRRYLCTLLLFWFAHKMVEKIFPKPIQWKLKNIFSFLKKKT